MTGPAMPLLLPLLLLLATCGGGAGSSSSIAVADYYMFNAAALARCAASHTARHSTHPCHSRRSVPPHTHY